MTVDMRSADIVKVIGMVEKVETVDELYDLGEKPDVCALLEAIRSFR